MKRQKRQGQKGEKQRHTSGVKNEQIKHKPREKTEDVEGTKSSVSVSRFERECSNS